MAAAVLGCIHFDPDVNIRGVILNHVAGSRHEAILRKSIEGHCGIPVLGALPKLNEQNFPERHMGLVPTAEHDWAYQSVEAIAKIAESYIDMDALIQAASQSPDLNFPEITQLSTKSTIEFREKPTIGIIRDSAFQFYYPENIEALRNAGADIIFFSPLKDDSIPQIDALYIGGGFPETHAEQLVNNVQFREELKALAEKGLPIYAECGGLMYLGQELILKDKSSYPMSGILPLSFELFKRPQGHGYTEVEVIGKNPYFDIGTTFRGHEFHYSKAVNPESGRAGFAFSMTRGTGIVGNKDGCVYKNVLATYTHLHALGMPSWADAVVRAARQFRIG